MSTTTKPRKIRAAIRGAGRDNLHRALAGRLDFTTSGSLRGERVNGLGAWDSGWLTGPDHEAFRRDVRDITYVVYSYGTPIYWETATTSHRVAQRFSVTTSKHQGTLYLLDMAL